MRELEAPHGDDNVLRGVEHAAQPFDGEVLRGVDGLLAPATVLGDVQPHDPRNTVEGVGGDEEEAVTEADALDLDFDPDFDPGDDDDGEPQPGSGEGEAGGEDDPPIVPITEPDPKRELDRLMRRWGISREWAVVVLNRKGKGCPEHKAVVPAAYHADPNTKKARWVVPSSTSALLQVLDLRPWRERLRWDDFGRSPETRHPTQDQSDGRRVMSPWRPVEDVGLTKIQAELERWSRWGRDAVRNGVLKASQDNPIHPVRDWLGSLRWDGRDRLDTWLDRHFGAVTAGMPEELAAAVGRCWMIAAVARVMEPGCKVDTVLMLAGPQGYHKSQALEVLAGTDPQPAEGRSNANRWHGAGFLDLNSKDAEQVLDGKWIWELAEWNGRAELNRLKAYLTNQTPAYRRSYGAWSKTEPRQSVFAATVNPTPGEGYLPADLTGNRRFWPVPVIRRADLDGLRRERDQLWAEAVARYQRKEAWWLDYALEPVLDAWQRESGAEEEHPWTEQVDTWLRAHPGRAVVTVGEVGIEALNLPADKIEGVGTQRGIAAALKACGGTFTRARGADGRRGRKWTNPHHRPDASTVPSTVPSTDTTTEPAPQPALPLPPAPVTARTATTAPSTARRSVTKAPDPGPLPYDHPDDPGPMPDGYGPMPDDDDEADF